MAKDVLEVCENNCVEYATYVNANRSIPGMDGLKPVFRRILLALDDSPKKFMKTATISGHTIGHWHPHGDASVDGAIATMVNAGLLEGQGSWGSFLMENLPAASSRYTEVKLPQSTIDECFKYLTKDMYEEGELEDEPKYLPVKIPIALTTGTQGLGYGINCVIPAFEKKSLVAALFTDNPKKLKLKDRGLKVLDADIGRLWEEGLGSVTYSFDVRYDRVEGDNVVIIEGDGKLFKPKFNSFFKSELEQGLVWYRDESTDHIKLVIGKTKGIRRLSLEEIYDKACKCSKKKIAYRIVYYDNFQKKVVASGVRSWLRNNFMHYQLAVMKYMESEIDSYNYEVMLMELASKVAKLLEQKLNSTQIAKKLKVDESLIKCILDKPIKYLSEDYRKTLKENKMKAMIKVVNDGIATLSS